MRCCFLALLVVQSAFAATCFLNETSRTPYVALGVTIEKSLKWCFTACDDSPGCSSVVFDAKDGSCVKQSDALVLQPSVCQEPYTRHYMTDVGCPYGDPMAAMGSDPCARLMPFVLDYDVDGTNRICPQRFCDGTGGPPIIVRYRDESGVLKTMDNCNNNQLSYDSATGKVDVIISSIFSHFPNIEEIWKLSYNDKYGNFSVIATAVACAEITNAAACPCPPISEYAEPNLNPKGPLLVNTIPACPPPYYPKVIVKNAKTGTRTLEDPNTFIAICMGGSWMACGKGALSYTAMKIGGCGTP
ncbi:hypothetical protein PRIPAC_97230 [Pristionchus pacificus]|uniref:Uncharacterized protein n=1 Tax=Pristionchus pacificus TaxID=54126 RepID=A0A2A6D1A4_PRIPA|nr:hypothetical protein PRIPAC_97230 [Pristionchus pacificus]|eukprot:PDM84234.1 hypothetical protein PRIPAC_33257 [Pristionchus pacificus]